MFGSTPRVVPALKLFGGLLVCFFAWTSPGSGVVAAGRLTAPSVDVVSWTHHSGCAAAALRRNITGPSQSAASAALIHGCSSCFEHCTAL